MILGSLLLDICVLLVHSMKCLWIKPFQSLPTTDVMGAITLFFLAIKWNVISMFMLLPPYPPFLQSTFSKQGTSPRWNKLNVGRIEIKLNQLFHGVRKWSGFMRVISEGLWEDSFMFSKSWYSYLHWVVKNPAMVFPYNLNTCLIEQWHIIMQNIINFNAKLAIIRIIPSQVLEVLFPHCVKVVRNMKCILLF